MAEERDYVRIYLGRDSIRRIFLIFDYYRNFEYFSVNGDGAKPTKSISVVATIFNLRTDLKYILQDASYQSDPDAKSLHDELKEILHKQIKELNRSRLDVRRQLKLVESLSQPDAMTALSLGDTMAMKENISPLFKKHIGRCFRIEIRCSLSETTVSSCR